MEPIASKVLLSISPKELDRLPTTSSSACSQTSSSCDFEIVSSYNWLNPADEHRRRHPGGCAIAKPTIVVPGAPKVFVQWRGGKLNEDTDLPFADENRYFMPDYPLEPLIRAVLREGHDPLAFQTLDVVTDRDNLRRLFDFCKHRGQYYNERTGKFYRPKSFTISLERVGELVLLEQNGPVEHPKRPSPIYGRDFEQRCTRPFGFLSKGTYYAIVKYSLGGVTCLVRVNADCAEEYVKEDTDTQNRHDVTPKPLANSKLSVIDYGYRKEDFNFIELTTKSADAQRYPEYVWDQLYFGCAKAAYIGWHTHGMCQYPQRLTLAQLHQDGRMRNKPTIDRALRNTGALLKRIIEFVRTRPAGELYDLVYDGAGEVDAVELRKREHTVQSTPNGGLLPAKLKFLLENGDDDDDDDDDEQLPKFGNNAKKGLL